MAVQRFHKPCCVGSSPTIATMEEIEFKNQLKKMLKEYLEVKTETRCEGHMAPYHKVVQVIFDGEVIDETIVMTESCYDDEWTWG